MHFVCHTVTFLIGVPALLLALTTPALQGAEEPAADNGGSRWGANYFPNVVLTNQEGEKVRFFDDLLKDKVVVINFIYTTCPDSCPLETARLLEVQRILGDRVGKDVFMYSISIDPKRDTPAVLKEYARKFHVAPGWSFLTGRQSDITLLRKRLGLYIDEIQEEDSYDHNLSLIIGNQATGRWMTRSPFENAHFLADQIGSWLHNWKPMSSIAKDSYANAPKLRNPKLGETLFRTRCAACHTVGAGDISKPEERRAGPDLFGVTRMRDPEWLARWIAEPDKMLAEKDPIVMVLFEKYNKLPMPNMQLNELEVKAVIDFLEEETARIERTTGEKPCCNMHLLGGGDDSPPLEPEDATTLAVEESSVEQPPHEARSLFSVVNVLLFSLGAGSWWLSRRFKLGTEQP